MDTNNTSQIINNTTDSVLSKFDFTNNIKQNVNDMVEVITNTSSIPSFSINVKSKWYTGNLKILDLSWYAPYKEYGDNIICIFAYLLFLWNIFLKLPDILKGAGASVYNVSSDYQNIINWASFDPSRDKRR